MIERDIFAEALQRNDPAERSAYLEQACAGDATLRRRVEMLLQTHADAGAFMERPAAEVAADLADATDTQAEHDDEEISLDFLEPAAKPDSLGQLGHYKIIEVLGFGAFGVVLKAVDELLQRIVAVKVMAPRLATASPARKRFLREARSAAAVRHENVVHIYAVEEKPIPYLVMEYVDGQTLQQRLDQRGPLDVPEVLRIGAQIANGLAAAHALGLIHRDIKPSNILLEAGSEARVKITDFGLARTADDASLTQSGLIAGTPMYMAPEQAKGEAVDCRADLFSLGSVLYVMVTGRPPFRASTTMGVLKRVADQTPRPIREIIPETPEWLCEVIARLHSKKPDERFASAKEVADALVAARSLNCVAETERRPSVEPASPVERPGHSRAPRRWLLAAALLVCLAGALGATEATGVTKIVGAVIRVLTPDGTLVVEVNDPGVSVTIDGEDMIITGAGAKEIRLKPGQYKVLARKDGKVLSQELVTVEKNGRQVVRISREAAPAVKSDPDRRAAEYVLSIGGTVQVNAVIRDLKAVGELPKETFRLTAFSTGDGTKVSNAGMAAFEGCTNLTQLDLPQTYLGDAGVFHFRNCNRLIRLSLYNTNVSDVGLANFKACKDLRLLSLSRISDAGLTNFQGCKEMTELILSGDQISDVGLAYFKDCKKLRYINFGGTQVSDAMLAAFAECKSLEFLGLGDTRVSDAGLAHFKGCKKLTYVNLEATKVTPAGVAELHGALPQCVIQWAGGVIRPSK